MKQQLICALTFALAASLELSAQQQSPRDQNLPPGLQKREQLPPGLSGRDPLPPGLEKRGESSTNTSAAITDPNVINRAEAAVSNNWFRATNRFAGYTNQTGLTPTSTEGTNNRVYGTNTGTTGDYSITNRLSLTNRTSTTITRDQAATPSDQRLLVQIRRAVTPALQPSGGAVQATTVQTLPVYFVVRQNVVTLLGTVATTSQSRQIQTMVQRTPGVVRVINQLEVNAQVQTTVGGSHPVDEGTLSGSGQGGSFLTNTSSMTTTNQNGATIGVSTTNRAGMVNSNAATGSYLPPTSGASTTNRAYPGTTGSAATNGTNTPTLPDRSGLPPGLQKRDQLPPGLEKRDQLPPGLDRRSGSNTNQLQ